ncbi:Peptidase c40 [Lasiodiplodia theobromae]|uniref:Peptidase c40 n=1 Tax=Lasiodiplodia theobromae TaxID=45133 RepID=UPI0015C3D0C8|nr:Peptidase c40 [Lasiodiplodia theobromae]KAF4537520.1 Peptidase c40 [Lasiodiplodia theobromae]
MPHHPAEETATGNITDQVAKESSDSTASTHPLHDTDTNVTSGGAHSKAHVNDHKAAPGPVIAEKIGQPASKEELKARAAELNK